MCVARISVILVKAQVVVYKVEVNLFVEGQQDILADCSSRIIGDGHVRVINKVVLARDGVLWTLVYFPMNKVQAFRVLREVTMETIHVNSYMAKGFKGRVIQIVRFLSKEGIKIFVRL